MKPHKSLQMFDSPLMEKFTHVHPIIPLLMWGPLGAFLIYHSVVILRIPGAQFSKLALAGLVTWTLAEYVLHRYFFHLAPTTPLRKRLQFIVHGVHHDDPQDPTRLVMPPIASLIFGLILFPLFRSFLGPISVEPFFAFFLVGYLCYDYIHFSVHHFKPRTRIGRFLKDNHMKHHFVGHEARWGVSNPLWDYVFGTTGKSR